MTWLQPVRVELPSSGQVSVYSATVDPLATIEAPAQFSVNAGHIYRLRVTDMPEFPDVEVYPSIEILDRLHPPAGQEANYPIPIVLSAADLKEAIDGRMVTRVIYLEDPKFASQLDRLRAEVPQTIAPTDNALQEAGKLGRPGDCANRWSSAFWLRHAHIVSSAPAERSTSELLFRRVPALFASPTEDNQASA